ncbi:hypothetical protein [Photobacterium carnosum]|uniref:hypothetical protein n=1 Tax=Photobacterium carnosum TaxID=2023717 RepID=UPI001E378009|nr:hypothetical protein [Photobacterium carnosum]MCD9513868.1 hypothetical protein [Photobacterium carnosum]
MNGQDPVIIKEINAVLCLSELKALTLSLQACFAVGRIETSRGHPFAAIFKPRQPNPLMQRNVTIGVRRDKIGMCIIGIGYNLKKKSATLHAHFSYADGLLLLEQLAVFCDCLQTRGHSNDLD